ncbi:uncharacterized protein METZ01_LOCUS502795, partial [marine metagenome]
AMGSWTADKYPSYPWLIAPTVMPRVGMIANPWPICLYIL